MTISWWIITLKLRDTQLTWGLPPENSDWSTKSQIWQGNGLRIKKRDHTKVVYRNILGACPAPQIRVCNWNLFSYFSTKTCVLGDTDILCLTGPMMSVFVLMLYIPANNCSVMPEDWVDPVLSSSRIKCLSCYPVLLNKHQYWIRIHVQMYINLHKTIQNWDNYGHTVA